MEQIQNIKVTIEIKTDKRTIKTEMNENNHYPTYNAFLDAVISEAKHSITKITRQ